MLFRRLLLRFTFLLALVMLHASFTNADTLRHLNSNPVMRWTIEKNSSLRVEGSSNVNEFRCDIGGYFQRDTIYCFNNIQKNKPVQMKGALSLNISTFDCHQKMITSDLRKTLKAEQHPKLIIRFLSLERMPVFNGNTDLVRGLVSVELAGTTKTFDMLYSFIKPTGSTLLLNGGRTFNFSDFKLKPPTKVAGMIKIKDEFNVQFRLVLNPV